MATPLVTRAQLAALGIAWPAQDAIEEALVLDGLRIDLDATIRRLQGNVDFAKRQLEEMYRFARQWSAPVDDTTDRREDMVTMRMEGEAAIRALEEVCAALARVKELPVVDEPGVDRANELKKRLRAVLDAPDAIAPRLAYAEALADDDPYREFIRVDCAAEEGAEWHPARYVAYLCAMALAHAHGREWRRAMKKHCETSHFRRGFLEHLVLDGESFEAIADAVFALAPVQKLTLGWRLPETVAHPGFRRIRSLAGKDLGPKLAALATAENASGLRELWLEGPYGAPEAFFAEAAKRGTLGALARLVLWDVRGADAALAHLVDAPALPALEDLTFYRHAGGAKAIEAFVRGPTAARLRRLAIDLEAAEDGAALARGGFPELQHLDVDGCLDRVPLTSLATLDVPRLESLKLTSVRFDEAGARALAALPLPALRDLHIYSPDLDATCARALAEAPWLPRLERLVLRGKHVDHGCLGAILPRLGPSLRCLEVPLRDADAFVRSPGAAHVVKLAVDPDIGEEQLQYVLGAARSLVAIDVFDGKRFRFAARLREAGLVRAANAQMVFYAPDKLRASVLAG